MAVVLGGTGWEAGNVQLPGVDQNSATIETTKKTGVYNVRLNYSGSWVRFPFPAGISNPSVSVWIHHNSGFGTTNACYIQFFLSTGETIELRWDGTNHTWDAYVNGAKVADGTVSIPNNDYFHTQFAVVIDNAGSINVKVDGHESIAYSGDTQPGAAATCTYVRVLCNGNYYTRVDDFFFGYDGYLGDLRGVDIRPNGNSAVTWTPSAGANWQTIDETPASTADYNEVNTDARADELTLTDYDGATWTPRAVIAWVYAYMLAATGDAIKVGIDSNGVDDDTQHNLATSGTWYYHCADQNPDGPAAWDDAAIDALLLRYESVIA